MRMKRGRNYKRTLHAPGYFEKCPSLCNVRQIEFECIGRGPIMVTITRKDGCGNIEGDQYSHREGRELFMRYAREGYRDDKDQPKDILVLFEEAQQNKDGTWTGLDEEVQHN